MWGSDLGLELAKVFAANDFDLVLAAEDDLTEVTAATTAAGAHVEAVRCDLRTDLGMDQHMAARGKGRILFTSSILSTMPGPFQAVYNASKSFDQSLALRNELEDTGVTATSLMPGPTDTEFFARADMEDTKVGAGDKDDPADVARDGFEALMAGDERVVSASLRTRLQGRGGRFLPDSAKAALHRGMAEPGGGE